ncbi:MAG: hypothetical protein ABIG61_05265 [Planctomycetota bacterium]
MYKHLSLLRLTELIARNSDEKALQELHNNRKVFHYYTDKHPLRLAEFADRLRQSKKARQWCNGDLEIREEAYDLTIGKFSNLPNSEKNSPEVKLKGPNCIYYYEAFARYTARKIDTKPHYKDDDREKQVSELLQNYVIRQFRLSCQRCCREGRELVKRYRWNLGDQTMDIMIPVDIPRSGCSKWLTERIPDVGPTQPGEQGRVQAIVDEFIGKRKLSSLEDIDENEIAAGSACLVPEIEREMTVNGLADVVADEKARNIRTQRKAIRQLGRERLQQLIRRVFESLSWGEYEVLEIADSFEINRTAFSRFAGRRWLTQTDESEDLAIPDLWFNTAQVLAGHPVFVRVAQKAGILKRVEEVLKSNNAPKKKWS